MYEKLDNFLHKSAGIFKRDLIMGAMYTLERYGHVGAWSEICQMLDTANDVDVQQVVMDIEIITNTGLNVVLNAHQIVVDNFNISVKIDILDGLKDLQDYENHATILQFTDLDDDPIHTLSDLLEVVTMHDWAHFANELTSVSSSLIRRLGDIHREMEESVQIENALPVEEVRRQALLKFIQTYPTSIAKEALINDLTMVGTPFKMIIHRYRSRIDVFEPSAAQQAAIELVGFALMSDITLMDFAKQCKDLIDECYADVNFITQVDVEMDNVLNGVMSNG